MKFTAQPSEDDSARFDSAESRISRRHACGADIVEDSREGSVDGKRPPSASRRIRIALSWAVVIGIAVLIFWMSAKDGVTLDEKSGLVSIVKSWLAGAAQAIFGHPVDVSPVGHFTEYLAFGAALANALRWHLPARRAVLCAVGLASLYGITDEIHQIFVPMRSCDPADWMVDTVAACIGAFAMTAFLKTRRKGRG